MKLSLQNNNRIHRFNHIFFYMQPRRCYVSRVSESSEVVGHTLHKLQHERFPLQQTGEMSQLCIAQEARQQHRSNDAQQTAAAAPPSRQPQRRSMSLLRPLGQPARASCRHWSAACRLVIFKPTQGDAHTHTHTFIRPALLRLQDINNSCIA